MTSAVPLVSILSLIHSNLSASLSAQDIIQRVPILPEIHSKCSLANFTLLEACFTKSYRRTSQDPTLAQCCAPLIMFKCMDSIIENQCGETLHRFYLQKVKTFLDERDDGPCAAYQSLIQCQFPLSIVAVLLITCIISLTVVARVLCMVRQRQADAKIPYSKSSLDANNNCVVRPSIQLPPETV